ncbi:Protein of uncharacterised function (DUF1471) [Providencia rustigianii]|uniref:YdgH/BhsA/McbA-like domain-containing protein n=7 Tax=Providencia rustigianii TaxID=158850 RepID=D1P4P8_9GAMM|nr:MULTISPECIES: DUF1471 domain-containing protein [Providencia]EFB71874.1 hypothetical protein PROVRUST_07200 [Providencia rustigianii DSM 4541]MTC55590.1 DUF1471 domain-containing protein [Providencia rustigianii]SPY78575.1 Protein of uncharacterised function (DUF1471) [Providencia rustigianii]SUC28218.1 Protein of uncharacterised function (DUF1471) [Providencia rustigianii]SUC36566.1 Protein of uncharacterised function (DUF1471) [Providencia rustigianii]
MNKLKIALVSLFFLSPFAMSATEINYVQSMDMKLVSNINVVMNAATTTDYANAVSQKADEAGAKYFIITSVTSEGEGNDIAITASLYNK